MSYTIINATKRYLIAKPMIMLVVLIVTIMLTMSYTIINATKRYLIAKHMIIMVVLLVIIM